MNFWLIFAAYEGVWLATVMGAGRDLIWPGAVATFLFAAWRFGVSKTRAVEARLVIVALALGLFFDAALVWTSVATYTAGWPSPQAPLWLTLLWLAFALTIVPLFGHLHQRPWLAALLGAIGGPVAYLGAARGWHVVAFQPPAWHALGLLTIEWAIALPLLCMLARHWLVTQVESEPFRTRVAP